MSNLEFAALLFVGLIVVALICAADGDRQDGGPR